MSTTTLFLYRFVIFTFAFVWKKKKVKNENFVDLQRHVCVHGKQYKNYGR